MLEGSLDLLKDLLSGGVGAFLGAWFAFKLENQRQERETRGEKLSAAKRAQFVLNRQCTQLKYLESKMRPLEADAERWRGLEPVIGLSAQNRLDLPSLYFLLDSKNPRLLDELAFCDDQYCLTLEVLEQRNRAVFELFAKLEALRSSAMPTPTHASIDAAVGLDIKGRLTSLTDGLYASVPKAGRLNEDLCTKLADFIRATFLGERPIGKAYIPMPQEGEIKSANTAAPADG